MGRAVARRSHLHEVKESAGPEAGGDFGRPGLLLLGVGLAGVGLNLLLAWGCQIIHTQSYQSLLAIILGLLLLLDAGPRWLYWSAATASIGYGLFAWVLDPLREGLRLDPLAIATCALLLLAAPLLARGAPYNTRPPDPAPSR